MKAATLYGAIEAGGTKFRCAVGRGPQDIVAETVLATRAPEQTLKDVVDFFLPFVRSGQVSRLGLGSFGPVDLRAGSATYGHITSTPKVGWQDTDIHGRLEAALEVPIVMDTDVNAAALGEWTWGASRELDPSLYLTVGTGIGGGLIKDGSAYQGLLTLEMGHMRIPHDRELDAFPGACPYHADCLEGLASGPAIEKRAGMRAELMEDADPFWDLEAGYLAYGLANMIVTLSPKIIILGGGVMRRRLLWPKLRSRVREVLNGYVRDERLLEHIEEYIVPPVLGDRAGLLGALALAGTGAA